MRLQVSRRAPESCVAIVVALMWAWGWDQGLTTATQAAEARAARAEQDQPSGNRPKRPVRPVRKPPQPNPDGGPASEEAAPVTAETEAAVVPPEESATTGVQPVQIPPDVQRQIEEIRAREAAVGQSPVEDSANPGPAPIPTGTVDRPDAGSPVAPTANPGSGVTSARPSAEDRRRQGRRAVMPGTSPPNPANPAIGPASPDATGGIVGATINIPAMEGGVPPENRLYSFSIKDAPYSVLIEGIAQQTGLGILGSAPPDGTVTFITDEQLTFADLLQRVRELLFNYKPIDPYWMLREVNGLRVLRVVDYLRELKPELMFPSVEAFEAANLADHELVLVLYTPKKGSLANLTVVRDFLPDYLRVTPMEGRNTVAIFALARDIRKYLELVDIFVTPGAYDPRTLELIPVEFTTPSAAFEQLQRLMEADFGGQAGGAARPPRVRTGPGGSPLESVPEPSVSVVPDDAQGVLIVRAMQDKIEEIRSLLKVVDVNTEVKYIPVVIPVRYNEPEAIIATVQQVLARGGTTAPTTGSTPKQSGRRPKRPRGATPALPAPGQPADPAAGVTMMPHPAGSAIILLADDDTVEQVRKLVADLDIPTTVGPVLVTIEFADPETVVAAITQMMGGGASPQTPRGGAAGARGVTIVSDPGGAAIWVTGSPKDVDRVKELVKEMDRAQDPPKLHVVRLVNQTPSFVVQILTQVDGGGGVQVGQAPATGRGGRRVRPNQRPAMPAGEIKKFTPDDENRRLFILCTEPEWVQYKAIIDDLESEPPLAEYQVVAVEHISPDEAIEKLQTILAGGVPGQVPPGTGASTGLRMIGSDTGIIVMGATPVDMTTIRSLLAEFDRPVEIEQRTFVIRHVNPAELKVALEQLLADGVAAAASPRSRGRQRRNAPVPPAAVAPGGGGGGPLTIVQVENSLVVKAAPALMTQVAEFIDQFDVPRDKPEMRVYEDFPRGTNMYELVEAVQSLLNFEGARGAAARPRAADVPPAEGVFAPRFVPQQAVGRLIVMARPEQFAEIEATLETLKNEISVTPVVTEFIQLKHADADAVVELVDPLLALHVERLIAQGEVAESVEEAGPAPAAAPPNPRVRQPGRQPKAQQRPYHFVADAANRRVVVAAEEAIVAEARRLVAAFDVPGSAVEPIEVAYINVKYGNPEEIVGAIDPVIAMKVQEFVAGGEISGELPAVATDPAAGKTVGRPRRGNQAMIRDNRRYHLASDVRQRRIVVAGPKSVLELTRKLVADFDLPGSDSGRVEIDFLTVAHGLPSELVERMDPILQMRVQQFVLDENLAAEEAPVAGTPQAINRGRPGTRGDSRRYHLEPDDRNGQIIVAAPRPVIDEARSLLSQMDKPGAEDEIVFETVALENTDAAEMVLTISGLMQIPAPKGAANRRAVQKGAPPAAAPPAAPSMGGTDADRKFTVVAAPGGAAVVLQGRAGEVAQAKSYILRLDAEAAGNKTVHVFQIRHADIRQLVNMIVSQVGIEEKPGAGRPTPPKRPGVVPAESDTFESEFEREITRTGPDLYLHADLISKSLTVVTTPTKLALIENLIGQVDNEDTRIARPILPQMTYALKYANAFDAADNLRALLTATWQPDDEIPDVSYTSFGNLLVVRYPDASRFPEIEGMIADSVDREVQKPVKAKAIPLPPNMSAEEVAKWLQANLRDFDVKLENKTPLEEEKYGVEEVHPPVKSSSRASSRCVLPASVLQAAASAGSVVFEQTPPEDDPPSEEPSARPVHSPVEDTEEPEAVPEVMPPPPDPVEAMIREKAAPLMNQTANVTPPKSADPSEDKEERDDAPRPTRREEIRVIYDNSTGNVIIEGTEDALKDAPDWIEEMREGSKELNLPPDVRVIRVKYIDVRTAETIINEMFNATRAQNQQMAAMNQARQQQLALQRRMQLEQQRAAAQGGARGQQPGQIPGQLPPGQQQVPQIAMPEIPEAAVRVYANPRDRTLIVRADSHQFGAVYKLLATIDQPKPYDSTYRIFELERLNAEDVESLLREWLGLNSGGQAAGSRQRRMAGGAQPGQPGGMEWGMELPETLIEPVAGQESGLGIDPTDIKLSSNAQTNTILALAPVAALDYIGNLIKELEASAGAERVWRSYHLAHARVDDVVDFLEERFADRRPVRGTSAAPMPDRPGSRGGGSRSGSRTDSLNSPVFVPYSRLNMLSVYATEEHLPAIEEALKQLDLPAADEQYRHISLTHADAGAVADTLTALFGAARSGGGRRTGGGTPGAAAAPASEGSTFVGEPGGKIVFYRAPEMLYPRIEEVVRELESQSKSAGVLRILQLKYARPSDVARAVEQAYGSTRGGSSRSNRGAATGAASGGFTVTANDATKQLFVLADDATFAEVEGLVIALDQPAQIGFDFRIFPLQYADAKRVHETMTRLVQEYLQRLPRDQQQLEAFSVQPDEKANALVVLGGPVVFGFVEEALRTVDVPANARDQDAVMMVVLENGDANEVAQSVNRLWSQRLKEGEKAPVAEPVRSLNALVVRGTQSQLDSIKKEFVDPLQSQAAVRLATENIPLTFARAEDVAQSLMTIYDERRQALKEMGPQGSAISPLEQTVVITADPVTNQLVVQASASNLEDIRRRVAQVDVEDVAKKSNVVTRIYSPKIADPEAVAAMIRSMAVASESKVPGQRGSNAGGQTILAIAEPGTRSVVVTANGQNHARVQEIIDQLDSEASLGRAQQVRTFQLKFAEPDLVVDAVAQLFKPGKGKSGGEVTAVAGGGNSVVVSAMSVDLTRIEELIGKLDSPDANLRQVYVINLQNADAESVAGTLDQIFIKSAPQRKGAGGQPISISALKGSKAVMVRCSPGDYEAIAAAVAEIDREEALVGEAVRVVTLFFTDATEMFEAVQDYLRKPGGTGGGKGSAAGDLVGNTRVSVLTQTNALVVSGDQEKVERIVGLITDMDKAGEVGSRPKIIVLVHAKVNQVLPVLLDMFGEKSAGSSSRSKGQAPPVITANAALNALIVRAGPTDMAVIEDVVAGLDTERVAQVKPFLVVQLTQGLDLENLAETVEKSVNESALRQAPGGARQQDVPSITVSIDARSSSLIIGGSPQLFESAEQLARDMESRSPQGNLYTSVIRTDNLSQEEVEALIDKLTNPSPSKERSGGRSRSSRPSSRPSNR